MKCFENLLNNVVRLVSYFLNVYLYIPSLVSPGPHLLAHANISYTDMESVIIVILVHKRHQKLNFFYRSMYRIFSNKHHAHNMQ